MDTVLRPTFIDPDVSYMGVSRFQRLNSTEVRQLEHAVIVTAPSAGRLEDEPLVVLIPYRQYLNIQNLLIGLMQGSFELASRALQESVSKIGRER